MIQILKYQTPQKCHQRNGHRGYAERGHKLNNQSLFVHLSSLTGQYRYHHVSPFVPLSHISVRFSHLFQRVASVNH